MIGTMSKISDFASNSIMGVVRKIVNHIVDNVDPQISDATDHLPARFSGTFNDNTRNLTMTIESQGASAENLVATVNIPAGGGGSAGPTYSAGNGIKITPANAIEIDTNITATKESVTALQNEVGDAFSQVAIGADGKSLDFTALDGQINNIALPTSNEWISLTHLSDYDKTKKTENTEMLLEVESEDTTLGVHAFYGTQFTYYTTGYIMYNKKYYSILTLFPYNDDAWKVRILETYGNSGFVDVSIPLNSTVKLFKIKY